MAQHWIPFYTHFLSIGGMQIPEKGIGMPFMAKRNHYNGKINKNDIIMPWLNVQYIPIAHHVSVNRTVASNCKLARHKLRNIVIPEERVVHEVELRDFGNSIEKVLV